MSEGEGPKWYDTWWFDSIICVIASLFGTMFLVMIYWFVYWSTETNWVLVRSCFVLMCFIMFMSALNGKKSKKPKE
jgi:hypothetical protein